MAQSDRCSSQASQKYLCLVHRLAAALNAARQETLPGDEAFKVSSSRCAFWLSREQ